MLTCERYHDFSAGHRVAGHESKCAYLHGHNYRVHFECAGDLDQVGRVIDFSVIKDTLCAWLENNWDHKFLAYENDQLMQDLHLRALQATEMEMAESDFKIFDDSIVFVPFNPTAENMAAYLLNEIAPKLLEGTGVHAVRVRVEETAKCAATAKL